MKIKILFLALFISFLNVYGQGVAYVDIEAEEERGYLRSVTLSNSNDGENNFEELEIWNKINTGSSSQQELDSLAQVMVDDKYYMVCINVLHETLQRLRRKYGAKGNSRFPIEIQFDRQLGQHTVYEISVQVYSPEDNSILANKRYSWEGSRENPINGLDIILQSDIATALEKARIEQGILQIMRSHPLFFYLYTRSGVPIRSFTLSNEVGETTFRRLEVWNGPDAIEELRQVAKLMVLDEGYSQAIGLLIVALQELEKQLEPMSIPYSIDGELVRVSLAQGQFQYRLTLYVLEGDNLQAKEEYHWPMDIVNYNFDHILSSSLIMALQRVGGVEELVVELMRNNHPIFDRVIK